MKKTALFQQLSVSAIARPIVLVIGWAGWVSFIYDGIAYPQSFEIALLGITSWFFADRTVKHIKERQNVKN